MPDTREIKEVPYMNDKDYMTVPEAAEALKCCHETIRRLVRSGRVPGIRIGTHIRVRMADLTAELGSRKA